MGSLFTFHGPPEISANNGSKYDHYPPFYRRFGGLSVSLTTKGKRRVIRGYEQRMETEITHPLFGYSVSYRRIIEVQARLLSRVIGGELKEYPAFIRR